MDIEILYNKYYKHLVFFANKYLNDYEASEDIVIDVLIKIKDKEYTNERIVLYQMVKNASLNHLKATKRRGQREKEYQDLEGSDIESEMVHVDVLSEILNSIKKMSPQDQKILTNIYFKKMTPKEYADTFGEVQTTVRSLLRHARNRLKLLLPPDLHPP